MNAQWKKPLPLLLSVFVVALLGCVIGCTIAIHFLLGDGFHRGKGDPHQRLHEQLGITASQEAGLEEMEERFARRETELKAGLATANAELASVLKEEQNFTPRVEAAVEKIHHSMATLQKATIEHIFEMRTVLTEEQYQHLLDLTGDALVEHTSGETEHSPP